jgi:hypothetical protein
MKLPTFRLMYLVRILYDNGYVHDCWCFSFKIENGTYTWEEAYPKKQILVMGAAHVVAVFQMGVKKRIVWAKKETK